MTKHKYREFDDAGQRDAYADGLDAGVAFEATSGSDPWEVVRENLDNGKFAAFIRHGYYESTGNILWDQ